MTNVRLKRFTGYSNKTEARAEEFLVATLVVLETVWALEAVYEIARQEILDSIVELILMQILKFEAQPAIRSFTSSASENKADLSGLLIAHYMKYSGCESVVTFDKRKAKLELFEILK